jgi:riboflavin kinase/FMN adenylyltransferase
MQRQLGLERPADTDRTPTVVAIGKFFAVHRGHQALLQATAAAARVQNAQSVALTFDRHPLEVLRPGTTFPRLATLAERLDLIAAQGIDRTVVLPLTREFLAIEPEQFVREQLLDRLGMVEILACEGFRFGRGASGSTELLAELGERWGFRFTAVPTLDAGGEPISSSRVAQCLGDGRVEEASWLLGRPYALAGEVVRGDQVGRKLGFPTANVAYAPELLLPLDGVYVARVAVSRPGATWDWPAVVNLGVRPTVGGRRRLLEAHLLRWDGDLYGSCVSVAFLDRLRDERRFPSLEELRAQIERDATDAQAWFLRHTAERELEEPG